MEENIRNPRRKRKSKMEQIKEAYLPTVFLALTFLLVCIFIIGAMVRGGTSANSSLANPSDIPIPTTDIYAQQAQQLLAEAEILAANYDYQAAVDLLNTFPGDLTAYPALSTKLADYKAGAASLITWSDPAQVNILSFHGLIADPARAFANKQYGTAYNRNFVTIEEFSKILNQLYDNGYILVDLEDFTSCEIDADGKTQCQPKPLLLPAGKKPLVLVQTNLSYYTYMVDGDGDGLADKDGAGFASRLVLTPDGEITCEMVDATGNTVTGNYDLVPILNDFIKAHPDFSYRGARAILSPSGYDGVFGYRTNQAAREKFGEDFHDKQITEAKALVNALRTQGYTIGCYTYANNAYGTISAGEIQVDLRLWATEVSPIVGSTNILVYAQNSELEEYSGSKFNVLHNAGFRYYLGVKESSMENDYILLKRLNVTGSDMAHSGLYSSFFDAKAVLNPSRGNVPN